ncbi:MAG: DUF86 domain-containing protein [Candidatus Eisenbacteria sp.]|nr:DUF86 domain-containing protein [Candidatus Eisenbacteria bacterium]
MQRDIAHLLDMLDSAQLIRNYVADRSREEFLSQVGFQDQVIRRFEIIGEAARRVSEQMRKELPTVPWHEMIGLRNILIHDYGEVNLEQLWDIIQIDLPSLIRTIEPLIPPPSESPY